MRLQSLGVQFGITAITARLLTPADFGLFATANIVFVLAANTIGAGLILAIVREPVLDREIIGSTVLLSCCSAAAVALIGIWVAPFAARVSATADGETLTRRRGDAAAGRQHLLLAARQRPGELAAALGEDRE